MNNFKTTIGIEVHIAVNTKTKMFSSSLNDHNSVPNTNICPIDLAMPGTMPSPNLEVVVKAISLAKALNMKSIDKMLRFDRKNYFYQDLPKGFQITQQFYPIARDGTIKINTNKEISVNSFHIEEDTAKQFSDNGELYLDYNRAGCPLIEIVTDPVFDNSEDVKLYLVSLRRMLLALDISDAKMEDGSMRVDVNISVAPENSDFYGTRVEIKNINSLNNVVKAINYEIDRQIGLILSNKIVGQDTRKYDDNTNTTVKLRGKSNAIDYRYMTEPNILQIQLSDNFIKNITENMPMLPEEIENKYLQENVDKEIIELLLDNNQYQKVLKKVVEYSKDYKESARWIFIELQGVIKKKNLLLETLPEFILTELGKMICLLKNNEINSKQAKNLIVALVESKNPCTIEQLIKEFNYVQITDEKVISDYLDEIFENSKNALSDYSVRPERVEKLILGLLMKKTNGQANPQISAKIFKEKMLKKNN